MIGSSNAVRIRTVFTCVVSAGSLHFGAAMQAPVAHINQGAPPPPPPLPGEAELRRELMNLAEPIIADRIIEGYREYHIDTERLRFLSAQHRRLWRAILLEHRGVMTSLYSELHDDLAATGLEADSADRIDQSVFEELVEIVLRRFRSSSGKAKQCSMILLGAASFIGASRRAP
jgi:hypothetical protein